MKVKGIYALKLPSRLGDFDRILLQKEKLWVYRLKSLVPVGLNTEPAGLPTNLDWPVGSIHLNSKLSFYPQIPFAYHMFSNY